MTPEQHLGVSALRKMNATWLRGFSKTTKPVVIHSGAQPIATLIPYEVFMAIQRVITTAEGLMRKCEVPPKGWECSREKEQPRPNSVENKPRVES